MLRRFVFYRQRHRRDFRARAELAGELRSHRLRSDDHMDLYRAPHGRLPRRPDRCVLLAKSAGRMIFVLGGGSRWLWWLALACGYLNRRDFLAARAELSARSNDPNPPPTAARLDIAPGRKRCPSKSRAAIRGVCC